MSDTVKSWIEERRTIHTGGRDVLLQSSYELERESGIEEGADIDAIVDAHNMFPRALDALSAVLELHKPFEWSFGYEPIKSCRACTGFGAAQDNAEWPCATAQAIEGAINNE